MTNQEEEFRLIILDTERYIENTVLPRIRIDIDVNPNHAQILSTLWPQYHDAERLFHKIRKITDVFPKKIWTTVEDTRIKEVTEVSSIKNEGINE